jgi:hypothetical protein
LVSADRLPQAGLVDQAHGLEKLKVTSPLENLFGHRISLLVMRGRQVRSVRPLCLLLMESCVNELISQYSPRKRSNTDANRNNPLSE